ncbi:hypothetical protein [[Mycoplasma] testudinis]|uniref:hypothetical protein n=1 Tax=[Mycoplasma] testudinis TaxID=33924 RepID=UPI000484D6B3|nr:hypothetical protein [[Mycoplasma] testudinis]
MALNFEKMVSMFATATNGTDKLQLPDNQLGILMSDIVEGSTLKTLSSRSVTSSVDSGSITYLKIIRTDKKEKTTIGLSEVPASSYNPITLNWGKAYYNSVGFTASDLAKGVPNAAAQYMMLFADDYAKDFEIDGWKKIEETILTNKTTQAPYLTLPEKNKVNYIVSKLTNKLLTLVDKKEGIRFINRNSIVVHMKPELLDELSTQNIIGNRADVSFAGGRYSIGTFMGYTVISNQFLDKYDIVVATNYSIGTANRLLATNIGPVGNTNDIQVYYEHQSLMGIIYPTTIFGYSMSTAANNADAPKSA